MEKERNFTRIPDLLGEVCYPITNNYEGLMYNARLIWDKNILYQNLISTTHSSPHHSMFKEPRKVIASLSPYVYEQEKKEILNKIINGEETNIKVDMELKAKELVYLFKELFEKGRTTFTSKEKLSEWIIKNFRFFNNSYEDAINYKDFKKDTIQKTLMRDCKPPKNPILIE